MKSILHSSICLVMQDNLPVMILSIACITRQVPLLWSYILWCVAFTLHAYMWHWCLNEFVSILSQFSLIALSKLFLWVFTSSFTKLDCGVIEIMWLHCHLSTTIALVLQLDCSIGVPLYSKLVTRAWWLSASRIDSHLYWLVHSTVIILEQRDV